MADRRHIKNGFINGIIGKPLRLPSEDEDGEPIVKVIDKCDECGNPTSEEPIMEEASVKRVIESIIFNIPPSIGAKNDPQRVPQMYNAIERAGDEDIELREPLYKWLHRLLKREVPISAEFSKRGVKAQTYGVQLFSVINAGYVAWQLEVEDERVPDFFDRDDDKGDED